MLDKKKFYINGEWVSPKKLNDLKVIDPSTEEECAVISLGGVEDVNDAVSAATKAFETWAFSTKEERLKYLEDLYEVYKKRWADMAKAISLEMGSPIDFSTQLQAGTGASHIKSYIKVLKEYTFESKLGEHALNNNILHEPMERLIVDIPEDVVGAVTQLLAVRKGKLQQMNNQSGGRVRMEFIVPARGLIGFQTVFLTETRGEGVANHSFENFQPWLGDLRVKQTGSLVSDRSGVSNSYALISLQERGVLFVGPGVQVYEGMIIGENPRSEDMNVNPTRLKKQSNIRSSTKDETEKLTPFRNLSLEQTMELIQEDECLEVTPKCVRMRKVELS